MLPAAITSFHQHSHAPTQHQQAQLQADSAGGQGVVVFGVKHLHATDTAVKAAVHGLLSITLAHSLRTYYTQVYRLLHRDKNLRLGAYNTQ